MKEFVVISTSESLFSFSLKDKIDEKEQIVLNKDMPHLDNFFYTYEYFKKNINKVIAVLNEIARSKNIKKALIKEESLVEIIIKKLNTLHISYLHISPKKALSITECERIINNSRIKYLSCYFMPSTYVKRFKKRNIQLSLKYTEDLEKDFTIIFDSIDYDTVYNKKNIFIRENNKDIKEDFKKFLRINQNLKNIHMYTFSIELLKDLVEILDKFDKTNITIMIYQKYADEKVIAENFKLLKELNKNYAKSQNGEMKIIYTQQYLLNNLFKQLSYNNLKIISLLFIYLAIVAVLFSEFYDYMSKFNINLLNEIIINTPIEEDIDNLEEEDEAKQYDLKKVFPQLLKINNSTVGWLQVNNTDINYPVVRHSNNEYYLYRDFYKSKTSNGWIFMDYRNSIKELDDNTIIYGHHLKNESMFGTLDLALKKSWYTNTDNLTIKFDTLNTDMNWQVFSIYRLEYTTDYLRTSFIDEEDFDYFINLISKRSVYNFKNPVEYGDKILTLSTCIGRSNERLVVHAKLINEIEDDIINIGE